MPTQETVELVSLLLTVPTLYGCASVIWYWGPSAMLAVRQAHQHWSAGDGWLAPHRSLTPSQLITLGVVVGFFGSFLDNLYWGCAWFTHFLGLPVAEVWFTYGAWSNVPCRQLAGILSAVLHLAAFARGLDVQSEFVRKNQRNLLVLLIITYTLTFVVVVCFL